RIQPLIQPYFDDFGVEITQFTLTSATLPEEVTQYYDKVTGMNMVGGDLKRLQQIDTALAVSQPSNPARQGTQRGVALGMMMGQANQVAQPAAATPAPAEDEHTTKLQKIKTLFDNGLIDEAEYKAKKAEILAQM